jgi:predicted RNA methylase
MEQKQKHTSRELDQFYTNPKYAATFLSTIAHNVDLNRADILLEPSAGSGSFYNLLDFDRRVGLDLDPKAPGVIQQDFFNYVPPTGYRVITIGNPPFGKNAGLAVKFFNHAAQFSDVIAFIIPRTFRKASIVNRLNANFHMIYDETVPANSFIFNGSAYDVPCAAQIWKRQETQREKIITYRVEQLRSWFEIVDPVDSDFAIQRVGGRAGQIRTVGHKDFSPLSNYFIRAHDPRVLSIFQQVDFDRVKFNTAGNPSVSPSELVELFVEQAQHQNIIVELA